MDAQWNWLTQAFRAHPVAAWILSTVASLVVGGLVKLAWSNGRHLIGMPEQADSGTPPPVWQGTEIARVWTLDALRRARAVAPGTRLAIVDRGLVQFELPAGSPLPGRLDDLARKHALSATAQAIQFPAAIVDVSHAIVGLASNTGETVDAIIKLHVGVNPQCPMRLVESAPIRDGVISVAEVQALVEDAVRPWLQSRAEHIDTGVATNSAASLANEMDVFLRKRLFDRHGLVGGVRALSFQQPLAQSQA